MKTKEKFWFCISFAKSLHQNEYVKIHGYLIHRFFFFDCKEIQPVYPKGDQSWVFIGRTDVEAETPIFLPPHAKS